MTSDSTQSLPQGSRLISRVLPLAMRLWLQSQVDQLEDLKLDLQGSDRQLLSGYIPGVSVSARRAVYRGIRVHQVALSADHIRINLRQVLWGKPLQLQTAFPVRGNLCLSESDLNASLQSPLLQTGLQQFWAGLIQQPDFQAELRTRSPFTDLQLYQPQASLRPGQLVLSFHLKRFQSGALLPRPLPQIVIGTGLTVQAGHLLTLYQPQWLATPDAEAGQPVTALEGFQWNLGSEVNFKQFELLAGAIHCCGQAQVNP